MALNGRKSTATDNGPNPKKVKIDDDSSHWIEAVANYVEETQTDALDLANRGLGKEEVASVLKILRNSQVTELNLENNCLRNGMADIARLLLETKVKKLNVSRSNVAKPEVRITAGDLLQLFSVLKDSQIVDLSVRLHWDFKLNVNEAHKCKLYLKQSKLIMLNSNLFRFCPSIGASFFKNYPNATITCLDLAKRKLDSKALRKLSLRLADTKIKKLSLAETKLRSEHLTILVKGLVGSKVTDLDLKGNHISNLSQLFTRLKETQIEMLDLSSNSYMRHERLIYPDCLRGSSLTSLSLGSCLSDRAGEALMDSLRFSSVTKLDISYEMGLLTVKKFAENVQDYNLIDLDIGLNPLPLDAFFILGKCLRESKLTRIGVMSICPEPPLEADHLLSFLQLTKGSSICHIDMGYYGSIWSRPPVGEPKMLLNTTFTELRFDKNNLGNSVSDLIALLKFTAVADLDLVGNRIDDNGAAALAESLKETQIRRLNLGGNLITSEGAKALALSFKETNLLYLHLNANKIQDDGLKFLAENAKDTFVSVINVSDNPGKKVLLVDTVLWQNKISVHKFVSIFKQIAPRTINDEFCFDQLSDNLDVSAFLEKCMWFYRTVLVKPSVISILLEDTNVPFSREQIFKLVFEKFPRQFTDFIACRVEADSMAHVKILEKAEEMGVSAIVEALLLSRPLYTLDEGQGILHPLAYKLLLKYKQPVCNLDVEPRGVAKIVEYFTEHADIGGAQDVINLLHTANTS